MKAWDRLEARSDEELADELIAASLPELAARRDLLVEVLRARFEEVAARAFRQAGGAASAERARKRSASDSPMTDSPPTRRHSRRVTPSHKRVGRAWRESIAPA